MEAVAAEVLRAVQGCPAAADGKPVHVLNAGCGEGEALRRVEQQLADAGVAAGGLWGTDTSKLATRYAAKRQRGRAQYAVCSPHTLPFRDGSMDVVFSFCAPSPWDEFCRVLRPGGAVVVARHGALHLSELAHDRDADAPPKQFAAGLAENYVRACTREQYGGTLATHFVEMAGLDATARSALLGAGGGGGDALAHPVTIDLIISTHRVWLGTGGE